MKRILALVLFVMFLCGSALAADGYTLPEGCKTVPSDRSAVTLPDGLPEIAHVTAFSAADGTVTVELDREAGLLEIVELDFMSGSEKPIFSGENTASASCASSGGSTSVFYVTLSWEGDGWRLESSYNTWSGSLDHTSCTLTAAGLLPAEPYTSAQLDIGLDENGAVVWETRSMYDENHVFLLNTQFGEDGAAVSDTSAWYDTKANYEISVTRLADGTPVRLTCTQKKVKYRALSQPVSVRPYDEDSIMDECYDPDAFIREIGKNYPVLLLDPVEAATMTDLAEAIAAIPENARIWALNFGDYSRPTVVVFVTADPLFIEKDGKLVLNKDARDINGKPLNLRKNKTDLPAVELPVKE